MAKQSDGKKAFKGLTMSRLSSWRKEWWRWLKSRERQTISRRWEDLEFLSIIAFILIAIFSILLVIPPYIEVGVLEQLNIYVVWTTLGIVGLIFIVSCAVVFVLSFHHKTRRFADGYFHFKDLSKAEELEVRISKVETELTSVNQRLGNVENRLDSIEARLGNIETTLATLANKESKAGTE